MFNRAIDVDKVDEKCVMDTENDKLTCEWNDPETGEKIGEVEVLETPDGSPKIQSHKFSSELTVDQKEALKKRGYNQVPDNSSPLSGYNE